MGCVACSDFTACGTCASGFSLNTGTGACECSNYLTTAGACVASGDCPTGTYPDSDTMHCLGCKSVCATCTGPSTCTLCANNVDHYLDTNTNTCKCV